MYSDWSVECGKDDPVLVVPWASESSPPSASADLPAAADSSAGTQFIDLRENPYDLDYLPEAAAHPALLHALRALNAGRSAVFTAKCDAWLAAPEELAQLHSNLDRPEADAEAAHGFASYVDILWRDRTIFASFHLHEQILHRLARYADPLDHPLAAVEAVLRPAFLELDGPREGFAITLYVRALGPDQLSAYAHWASALEAVVAVLRGRDLAQIRTKAPD